jgi:hypothetical protein
MPLHECSRCKSSGSLLIGEKTCPTCCGLGYVYIGLEYPKGTLSIYNFKNKSGSLEELLKDPWLAFDLLHSIKSQHGHIDWWIVHQMYPYLDLLEKELLKRKLISHNSLPGGPNKKDEEKMTTEYRPYHAYREEVKATPSVPQPATQTSRTTSPEIKMTQEFEKKLNQIAEDIKQLSQPKTATTKVSTLEFVIPDVEAPVKEMTMKDRAKSVGKRVAVNAKQGALQGMVGAANQTAVTVLENQLGDKYPAVLKTPAGRKAVEALIPVLLMTICEFDTSDKIPGKEYVEKAAELALQDTSREAVQQLTMMLLSTMGPVLMSYQMAGKELADNEATDDLSDLLNEREKVVVQSAEEILAR